MKWQAHFGRPGIQGEAIKSVSFISNASSYTSQPKRTSECAHAGFRSIGTSAPDSDEVKLEEQQAGGRGAGDLLVPQW